MKVLMKPIDMIAWFDNKGKPTPIRFRHYADGSAIVINVRIQSQDEEKLAGNRMIIYHCQSVIDGFEKIFDLKYEINTCKWFLYRM